MDEREPNSVSDCCFLSEIPVPILHEIFYRLPVKSVMRCKAVCPDWNKFISKPSFTVDYAKKSPYTALLLWCNSLLLSDPVPCLGLLEILPENRDYELTYIPLKVPYLPEESLSNVASSNGFLCMQLRNGNLIRTFVTNPICGYTIQLPERVASQHSSHGEFYQFGFSPATNEFKVLRVVIEVEMYNVECEGLHCVVECEIFTVGVDRCWRRLPNSSAKLPYESDFGTLNGFFYWTRIGLRPDFISTFDLAEEKFGQISLPPSLLLESESMILVVFGNQLAIVDSSHSSQFSVWTMNKNSAGESWTKVVILSSWFPSGVCIRSPEPVGELQNGVMLFFYRNSLIFCNVEQKRCSEIKLKGVGKYAFYSLPGYSPNFLSHAEYIVQSEHCILLGSDLVMENLRLSIANLQQE